MAGVLLAALAFPLLPGDSADAATTIILVRHAEKARLSGDPPLSIAGMERAEHLCEALSDVPLAAIFSTNTVRTLATAGPTAAVHALEVRGYQPRPSVEVLQQLVLEHRGKVILMVGHSDTLSEIVERLGVPGAPPYIGDDDYDNLFVVTIRDDGSRLVGLRYGERT